MSTNSTVSPSAEFEQVIKSRKPDHPNIARVEWSEIKKGRDVYKAATLAYIRPDESQEISHHRLKLTSYRRKKGKGFDFDSKPDVQWTCEDQEIDRLVNFLDEHARPLAPGDHVVMPVEKVETVQQILQMDESQLGGLVTALASRRDDLLSLPRQGESGSRRMVAAALRAAHRSEALGELRQLVGEDAVEERFQRLLDRNWWMLGGRYVERVPQRRWTERDTVDMLLRRADGYFDVIELKRSELDSGMFKRDHGRYIVSSVVNDAVNQAAHYMSEIESRRDTLLRNYKVDLYKLRAKVIMGYIEDAEEDEELKRQALRMYNSHLHSIEVITYDELVRIGEHVIHADRGEVKHGAELAETRAEDQEELSTDDFDDEIPF